MKHFYFRYKDMYSHDEWSYTDGDFSCVEEAIDFYGFDSYGVYTWEQLRVFKNDSSIIFIVGDTEFTYFVSSANYKVRFLPTGEAASFSVQDLTKFMDIVKEELRNDLSRM